MIKTMKQIIVVVKVSMNDLQRSYLCGMLFQAKFPVQNAVMKIAISLPGVDSAAFRPQYEDPRIEVQGEGIDAVDLIKRLRNKIGFAEIISVTHVADNETTEVVEPEMLPVISSDGVPDQHQVCDTSLITSIIPVGDNEDTEMESEMLPMVSSDGVSDQHQAYVTRDASLITQYNDPYGRVTFYV